MPQAGTRLATATAMKNESARRFADLLRKLSRRQSKAPRQPTASLHDEMRCGSLVGLPACALIAGQLSGSASGALWGGLFGAACGALIGLLLWIGSDGLHEDRILPPAPSRPAAERAPRRERKDT